MTLLQAYLQSPKTRRALSKRPGEKGFSLIELVVVVAILAILAAIALPNFLGVSKDGQIAAAKNTLATIVKECAVKDTRYTDDNFGTSGLTGADASVSAATANLNGYEIRASGDPAAAQALSAINLAAGQPDTSATCYEASAVPPVDTAGNYSMPTFSVSFDTDTGETNKDCLAPDDGYFQGCFIPNTNPPQVQTTAGAAGVW